MFRVLFNMRKRMNKILIHQIWFISSKNVFLASSIFLALSIAIVLICRNNLLQRIIYILYYTCFKWNYNMCWNTFITITQNKLWSLKQTNGWIKMNKSWQTEQLIKQITAYTAQLIFCIKAVLYKKKLKTLI